MNELRQVFETVNIGLVILGRDLNVRTWNRWMANQSGLTEESVVGSPIFSLFPNLNNPIFLRNCKSVLAFGEALYEAKRTGRNRVVAMDLLSEPLQSVSNFS